MCVTLELEATPVSPVAGSCATALACMQTSSTIGTAVDWSCAFCRGYVRYFGLSVNQPVHIQGCGDFNIDKIETADDPCSHGRKATPHGVQGMDMAGEGATVLATADPAKRQGVARLNTPDPLAGEQTWPTEQVQFI